MSEPTKEDIYDAEINPLMAQIIDICKRAKIAMVATFEIPTPDDDTLICTSALTADEFEPSDNLRRVRQMARYGPSAPMVMLTTRDAEGNVTAMEAIVGD